MKITQEMIDWIRDGDLVLGGGAPTLDRAEADRIATASLARQLRATTQVRDLVLDED